jgi:hypothetical protein
MFLLFNQFLFDSLFVFMFLLLINFCLIHYLFLCTEFASSVESFLSTGFECCGLWILVFGWFFPVIYRIWVLWSTGFWSVKYNFDWTSFVVIVRVHIQDLHLFRTFIFCLLFFSCVDSSDAHFHHISWLNTILVIWWLSLRYVIFDAPVRHCFETS